MVDALVHRIRHRRVCAVDGARRGVDEVLDRVQPAAFEDVQRPDDVAVDVRVRVLERVANSGLGTEMHDSVELVFDKQRLHRRTIGEVDAGHGEGIVAVQDRRASLLQGYVVVIVEVVEADDRVAAFQQRLCGEEPDEAGGACDEDFQD